MSNYTCAGLTDEELMQFAYDTMLSGSTFSPSVVWRENTVNDYNFSVKLLSYEGVNDVVQDLYAFKYNLKLTAVAGERACIISYDCKIKNASNVVTDNKYTNYIVLMTRNDTIADAISVVKPSSIYGNCYRTYAPAYSDTLSFGIYDVIKYDDEQWSKLLANNIPDEPLRLRDAMDAIKATYGDFSITNFVTGGARVNRLGFITSEGEGSRTQAFSYDKFPFPVFHYNDTEAIIKYLRTGDDSGSYDPFVPPDPEYPKKYEIESYKTNFRVFLSPYENEPTRTKFSVIAYNNELISHFEEIEDYYGITVTEKRAPIGQSNVIQTTARLSMYPTVGFHTKVGEFYQIGMWFHNEDDTEHSLPFHCLFEPSTSSKVGCYVKGATLNGQGCERTAIEDGHRFTGSDGSWVEVLYRAPSIDDLNVKYSDDNDEDDGHTGTDSDYSGASGLRTFSIDAAGFDAINKKLWSTDWTTVFKSTTIDPVRCVIACKSIPFTASNVANSNIVIANLDTGVQRNYVKTVKTFDCGGVVIGYKRGDFTDITHTHVRCYLPYIGWVELPAEEVISRRAYPNVGISAHSKHLYFKYIVDFVDGSCRCIVSVGGTGESRTDRWYFDGNCGVDMPVTSDNHTQAISNALRSGVSTGLGVVSAIAGAVTGNAGAIGGGVMAALQNAPNMFPTYSYTATSNGSGYINSAMNQHIMIVVERANVQEPAGYTSRLGKPCNMVLPLGSLRGYTKCNNVDVSGINATPDELSMIKGLLESGVYL